MPEGVGVAVGDDEGVGLLSSASIGAGAEVVPGPGVGVGRGVGVGTGACVLRVRASKTSKKTSKLSEAEGLNPTGRLSGVTIPANATVDLQALVEGIVVSPEANPGTSDEIKQLVSRLGYSIPVQESSFTKYPHVITDLAEIIRFSGK